jgi:hypothetical protein
MAVRDAGWIQLYCASNQEAVDTTVQAFRIAERSELPVMVCLDGFSRSRTCSSPSICRSRPQVDALPAAVPVRTRARSASESHQPRHAGGAGPFYSRGAPRASPGAGSGRRRDPGRRSRLAGAHRAGRALRRAARRCWATRDAETGIVALGSASTARWHDALRLNTRSCRRASSSSSYAPSVRFPPRRWSQACEGRQGTDRAGACAVAGRRRHPRRRGARCAATICRTRGRACTPSPSGSAAATFRSTSTRACSQAVSAQRRGPSASACSTSSSSRLPEEDR